MSGVNLNMVASNSYCRAEIFFNRGNKEENKELFDFLYEMKPKIEDLFGSELVWERMDENVTCRIKKQLDGVSYFKPEDYNKMNQFMIETSVNMEKAFKDAVKEMNIFIKNKK